MAPAISITLGASRTQKFTFQTADRSRKLTFTIIGSRIALSEVSGYSEKSELLTDISKCLVHKDSTAPFCEPVTFLSPTSKDFESWNKSEVLRLQFAYEHTQLWLWGPERLNSDAKVEPKCPICDSKASGDGWAPEVRQVIGFSADIWLYIKRATCKSTSHAEPCRFSLSDSTVLSKLPPYVSHLFPGELTKMSGLSTDLQCMLTTLTPCGTSLSTCAAARNEMASDIHKTQEAAFLSAQESRAGVDKGLVSASLKPEKGRGPVQSVRVELKG
ncbi:hypothetical protein PLESTM_000317000 [Pleodorina starrii]|nr:hypothetical protein PLESTM_000317000 [Pleodorina starrii]